MIQIGDTILANLFDILDGLLTIVQPGTEAEGHLKALRQHEGTLVVFDESLLTSKPSPCKDGQSDLWQHMVGLLKHKLSRPGEYMPVAVEFHLPTPAGSPTPSSDPSGS